jgi:excinuclease UvrABC nuclease subunit
LLLDRSRKTRSCIYEHVQRCAGECRRNQAKENYRPKHRAITELGRRQVSVRLEKIFPSLDRNGASMAQPSV